MLRNLVYGTKRKMTACMTLRNVTKHGRYFAFNNNNYNGCLLIQIENTKFILPNTHAKMSRMRTSLGAMIMNF